VAVSDVRQCQKGGKITKTGDNYENDYGVRHLIQTCLVSDTVLSELALVPDTCLSATCMVSDTTYSAVPYKTPATKSRFS
jgi:hypothetical protein